ncbi:hypothetical protein HY637_03985 [Candidatus Woesearchaeota archaeon]|nr:hypothetical protein [Candidatus Woesearchaeota archaeon]
MKKRGQITIFLIIGLAILILFGVFYYFKSYSTKSALEAAPDKRASESDIVKAYVESCIKNVAEEALFEKIGEQGGYTDVNANPKYGESGTTGSSISPSYVLFQGENVPYYLEAYCQQTDCAQYSATPPYDCAKQVCRAWKTYENLPTLDAINKKLANYIAVEFEDCFKENIFEDIGIKIEKPNVDYAAINFDFSRSNVNVEVSFNEGDTSIKMAYPLLISKGDTKSKLDSFIVVLPIRLKPMFEGSQAVVDEMKAFIEGLSDTDYVADVPFLIEQSKCATYIKKDLTNLYTKASDSAKIVQFVDFSTFYNYYWNSYIFQFAVKNIKLEGNCVG